MLNLHSGHVLEPKAHSLKVGPEPAWPFSHNR